MPHSRILHVALRSDRSHAGVKQRRGQNFDQIYMYKQLLFVTHNSYNSYCL